MEIGWRSTVKASTEVAFFKLLNKVLLSSLGKEPIKIAFGSATSRLANYKSYYIIIIVCIISNVDLCCQKIHPHLEVA